MSYCRIYLPSKARIADVGDVLAILTWTKPQKNIVSTATTKYYTTVNASINMSSDYSANSTAIYWKLYGIGKKVNKTFFFEFGDGFHGMMFATTDFGLILGKRLVDFFGGKIDFNDADKITCDYTRPVRPDLVAEDGPLYISRQDRKFKLKGITQSEIDAIRPKSHYFISYGHKTILQPDVQLHADYTF